MEKPAKEQWNRNIPISAFISGVDMPREYSQSGENSKKSQLLGIRGSFPASRSDLRDISTEFSIFLWKY
eukprot:920480-Amorphochlora_amoeboformis.AAC.1